MLSKKQLKLLAADPNNPILPPGVTVQMLVNSVLELNAVKEKANYDKAWSGDHNEMGGYTCRAELERYRNGGY